MVRRYVRTPTIPKTEVIDQRTGNVGMRQIRKKTSSWVRVIKKFCPRCQKVSLQKYRKAYGRMICDECVVPQEDICR